MSENIDKSEENNDANDSSSNTNCELSAEAASSFSFSSYPNFEDIRKMHREFVEERNWGQYHKPINLLLAMTKEVGELCELFQWKDKVENGLPDWTEKEKTHLAQELSDVYLYLQNLAEKCQIDLPKAITEKMKQNALKYPADKVWGSSKKYTEY